MSNPEKLIQALSHMSMLSIEGYAALCDLIINNYAIKNKLITNCENNFKPFHNSNSDYNEPIIEALDCLFNHNNLSEEAICYFIEPFLETTPTLFQRYCPHILLEDINPK